LTTLQVAVVVLAQVALLACLVGLVRSGRWRLCYSFAAYLVVVLTFELLQLAFPERFYVWTFWLAKQTAYDAAKLALAVELTFRVCQEFPGAKAVTARWVLALLLLTAAGLVLRPWQADFLLFAAGELHARAVIGTLWLLVAAILAAQHYRLAVHPHHMGVLVGFGVYLAVFGALLRLLQVRGWAAYDLWARLDPPAYALLAFWFAWVAWRQDRAATEDYEAVVNIVRERATA
jgi:hypothetical protein